VLFTGGDFVIVDFEGEPLRPLPERRLKRWAAKDVAGMLRSFTYAAEAAEVEFGEERAERASTPFSAPTGKRRGARPSHLPRRKIESCCWTPC
jgi:predicted trehalose synthase